MRIFWWHLAGLSVLSLTGCGKKKSGEKEMGNIHLSVKTAGGGGSTLAVAADEEFKNSAIASGQPDYLSLYVTKMTLENNDATARMQIFADAAGKPIHVQSNTVDISSLFTSFACLDKDGLEVADVKECPCGLDSAKKAIAKTAEGKCPDQGNGAAAVLQVQEGTFSKLRVDFQVRAKVKGCVSGDFATIGSTSTGTQGERTYCTSSAAHTFKSPVGVESAADLELSSEKAEEMDYQISKANELYSSVSNETFLNFPIKDGIKIEANATATPQMNLVIDTHRMLRFYNRNTTTPPNPGMPTDRAYFFNSVLEESTFVFIGKPGEIRGFKWSAEACVGSAADGDCTSKTKSVVAGWMTIIKDSAGSPLVVGLMPDDDNTLTIIKGSNKNMNGINSSHFKANGSNFDITYELGENFKGSLSNVNIDDNVGNTQTTTFSGFQNYGGKIYLTRVL